MNKIQLLILLQVCLCWNFDEFQGPTSTLLSQQCRDSSMAADGEYFYCISKSFTDFKIYKNNGYGFDLAQTFYLPTYARYICNSDNGAHVRVSVSSSVYVYGRSSDGTYKEMPIINVGSFVNKLSCEDGRLIVPTDNDEIKVYST